MWKKIRIAILLIILLIVGVNAWRDMNQDWTKPIVVLLHPINADGQPATEKHIQQISAEDLQQMQHYLQQESQKYRQQPALFYFRTGRELTHLSPKVPDTGRALDNILWSLKFRYYAWKQHTSEDGSADVTLYLNYYDPHQTKILKHSVALQRGRIGSVNLFASAKHSGSNKVVTVHELLHAFGAMDKYDMSSGQPVYPAGYAAPEQKPLYPQKRAELMGAYIPLSEHKSKTPEQLSDTVISQQTAQEMGWLK